MFPFVKLLFKEYTCLRISIAVLINGLNDLTYENLNYKFQEVVNG